jgi:hypothetical protein
MSAPARESLSELVASAEAPSPSLFWRVAHVCARLDGRAVERLSGWVEHCAWVEASHALLLSAVRAQGYMAGVLPDGSAHVRVMTRNKAGLMQPIDAFRDDGDLCLATLEALATAFEPHSP